MSAHSEKNPTNNIRVIGIAGTAKNTGKTTTLNCLLKEAFHRNQSLGITGIGFDGEELDNVTLLPKPRVTVYPQFIVTTSEKCLEISSADVEILEQTGMYTSLGEIIILKVLREGLLVIAGPNKTNDLRLILERMKTYSIDTIIVDGSLNRIAPMSVVDSIILTTGGSRSTDIAVLCNEMHAIETLFRFPLASNEMVASTDTLTAPLLLEVEEVEELLTKGLQNRKTLCISKWISLSALKRLTEHCAGGSQPIQQIIFPDACALLMNEPINQTLHYISILLQSDISISYLRAPVISCMTVNPFFPEYFQNTYFPRYLNSIELINSMRKACSTPAYNSQETDPSTLFDVCLKPVLAKNKFIWEKLRRTF